MGFQYLPNKAVGDFPETLTCPILGILGFCCLRGMQVELSKGNEPSAQPLLHILTQRLAFEGCCIASGG